MLLLDALSAAIFLSRSGCYAQEDEDIPAPTADDDLGAHQEGSRTDAEAVER